MRINKLMSRSRPEHSSDLKCVCNAFGGVQENLTKIYNHKTFVVWLRIFVKYSEHDELIGRSNSSKQNIDVLFFYL